MMLHIRHLVAVCAVVTVVVISVLTLYNDSFLALAPVMKNLKVTQTPRLEPPAGLHVEQQPSKSQHQKMIWRHSMGNETTSAASMNAEPQNTLWRSKADIDDLSDILSERLSAVTIKGIDFKPTCATKDTIANSCKGASKCLRMSLPRDIKARVSQIVTPEKLQVTNTVRQILHEMSQKVSGQYDLMMVTGVSSNHYLESQAMIKTVHDYVMPMFKNFTLLFYNLGLSANERQAMVKYCKCTVLDFPFDKFPKFMRGHSCYSWKPVIVKAHAQQASVVVWADASIRYRRDPNELKTFIELTRQRGIQFPSGPSHSPSRTFRSMYHFFGDEPCAYLEMWQAGSGLGGFARDSLVDRAILEPWVACAVQKECMCMSDNNKPPTPTLDCSVSNTMIKNWKANKGKITYGLCHRFDQAVLSILVHKLYREHYRWILRNGFKYVDVRRGHKLSYFPKD